MGTIITFYSYKGGVGRSMALANIGYELAKRDKKILIVDWDLEAPGLDKYFKHFKIENSSPGLLQMLQTIEKNGKVDYKNYLWKINAFDNPIHLLSSGRDHNPLMYTSVLQNFDWNQFFFNNGGQFLENLRNKWRTDYDFVLIDSRTGLSDSSGICSILMPDILIAMFTANYQSLFGISDLIEYIQNARQKLEVDRMALTIIPIPARFGTQVEFKESQEWLERMADILKKYYSDWIPRWIIAKDIIEQIKIPQIDYFSFGEKLAVVEQSVQDTEGMGYIYSKIAALLASDCKDVESFIGKEIYASKKHEYEKTLPEDKLHKIQREYLYDIYLSFSRSVYQWVIESFMPALSEYLKDILGYKPSIYFESFSMYELTSSPFRETVEKSKTFILIFSSGMKENTFLNFEQQYILNFEKNSNKKMVFPIIYKDSELINLPEEIQSKPAFYFNSFNKETYKAQAQFLMVVEQLAHAITEVIQLTNEERFKPFSANKSKSAWSNLLSLAKEYEDVRKRLPVEVLEQF